MVIELEAYGLEARLWVRIPKTNPALVLENRADLLPGAGTPQPRRPVSALRPSSPNRDGPPFPGTENLDVYVVRRRRARDAARRLVLVLTWKVCLPRHRAGTLISSVFGEVGE